MRWDSSPTGNIEQGLNHHRNFSETCGSSPLLDRLCWKQYLRSNEVCEGFQFF